MVEKGISAAVPGIGDDQVRTDRYANPACVAIDPFLAGNGDDGCHQHRPFGNVHSAAIKQSQGVIPGQGRANGNEDAAEHHGAHGFYALVAIRMVLVWRLTGHPHDAQYDQVRCDIRKGMNAIHQQRLGMKQRSGDDLENAQYTIQ